MKVNLKDYGDFWTDFITRARTAYPDLFISTVSVKQWIKEFYGINVHVTPNSKIGEVYMMPQEYTAFLLKWG